jgi:hypothetical protein
MANSVVAAAPPPTTITRFFLFSPIERNYMEELMEKLLEDQLPFAWQPPRPLSVSIVKALHAAAQVIAREQTKKRCRDDDDCVGVKFPLHFECALLEITMVDPKLPVEQVLSVMLGGATFYSSS